MPSRSAKESLAARRSLSHRPERTWAAPRPSQLALARLDIRRLPVIAVSINQEKNAKKQAPERHIQGCAPLASTGYPRRPQSEAG